MHILTARWTEPCNGTALWTCQLTEEEANKVQAVLDWLEEGADQNWGSTLIEWELFTSKSMSEPDLESLDAVLNEIALNSRYNETDIPGEFYEGTHPDLDGRPVAL